MSENGNQFAINLRYAVSLANVRTRGESPAPWEVVMEALIEVEARLAMLEQKFYDG